MLPPYEETEYTSTPPLDDSPPQYTSQVYLRGRLEVKAEKQFRRHWSSQTVELNNTVLRLVRHGRERRFSMQNARVGFAADYTKGTHPVRLIADATQLLFDFELASEAVKWLDAFEQSINISLPLDLREEPRVPRQQGGHKEPCISDFGVLLGGLKLSTDDMLF